MVDAAKTTLPTNKRPSAKTTLPTQKKRHKFIQVKSGAVYAYSPELAAGRGAFPVDAQVAADYYRSIGSENAITKANPPLVEDEAPEPEPTPEPDPPLAAEAPPTKRRVIRVSLADKPATPKEVEDMIRGPAGS